MISIEERKIIFNFDNNEKLLEKSMCQIHGICSEGGLHRCEKKLGNLNQKHFSYLEYSKVFWLIF
jgi:hypothetical protein